MLTFFVTLLDLPFFCDNQDKIDLSLLLHAIISAALDGETGPAAKRCQIHTAVWGAIASDYFFGGRRMRGRKEVGISCAARWVG